MNTDQYKRVKEVFLAACDQPAEKRAEFVKSATEGDEDLRHEVEGLLKEYQHDAPLMPSEPEGPIGSMSALLTRAKLDSSPEGGKDKSNKYAEDPTHELDSTPSSKLIDDAHDQTSGSHCSGL